MELAAKYPTLKDVASRLDKDGKIDKVVELLSETNEPMDDIVFIEANDGTNHKTTVRAGLPDPTWRALYGGVQPSKSETTQITDASGMLEAYAEVDKALADMNGNTNEFRLSEDTAHLEGMSQSFIEALFYGDQKLSPEKITGLAPRYSSLTAENGENILDAGGTGLDNTSIWLVVWGPTTVHGFYPKGSKAGIEVSNKGQVTVEKADGSRFEAYRTHYSMKPGLSVRDWRYAVRIANIDVSELKGDMSGSSADLVDLMTQALELVPSLKKGRAAFYMNRKVRTVLRQQINHQKNVRLTREEVAGKMVTMFDEVPVRRTDKLLNTEEQVA